VWAPDSSALLFAGQPDRQTETDMAYLWTVPVSGGAPVRAAQTTQKSVPRPGEWTADNRVLFVDSLKPGLWEAPIDPRSRRFSSAPRLLTPGTAEDDRPVASTTGVIAFAGLVSRYRIVLLPLDGGPARPIDGGPGSHQSGVITADGNTLVYDGNTDATSTVTAQSLASGAERTLLRGLKLNWWSPTALGDQLYYQSEGRIFRTPATELCPYNQHLWDLSADGRYLLSLSDAQPKRVNLLNLATCHATELLGRPGLNLYYATFSLD
jgi:hypothetical protein